ncbi:outer membrane protein transport protein [Pseudenhygromyxa sp. WMMC2535]|uniref:OmpP1/FadL family transporter n=1 Tax=Pseudenhygromyxa sp. WMMC2535 TaxID=2712867 RepID=UPI0015581224|nr:outer membrane protein transport protein [Pseudenhygromyxa sp. WMMC2535]NVB40617.1 outer membrane protein transport protein [Pseudenhygromyxa sp. WMMC2535]
MVARLAIALDRCARPWLGVGVAVVFAGFVPCEAAASGLDVPHIGTTFSSPTANDAAALYWNPAMLGFAPQKEVLLGAGVVGGVVGYQRDRLGVYQYEDNLDFAEPIDPSAIDPSKTGAFPRVSSPILAPNAGGFVAIPLLRDRLSMGVGVYVPYAAPLTFDPEGDQRFALQQAFIAVSRISAGLAVKVHERVSIGASVSYVLGFAQLARIQDFGAVDLFGEALAQPPINQPNDFGEDAPSSVRELEVLARPFTLRNAVSHNATFNVAIAANPIDPLWLGLTYDHGSRANFWGDFQLDMDDEFFTQDLASQGLAFPKLIEGRAKLSFRLPKRIMLGIAYDISRRLRVEGNFAYVFWSDLSSFDITLDSADLAQPDLGIGRSTQVSLARDWKGTVHAEASVRARVGARERVRLSGTFGYHSPASPDETIDVASPDGHRLIGALGVGFQASERLALFADAEIQGILPRTVEDSDYDLGNGRYELLLSAVMLHLQVRFGDGGKLTKKQRAAASEAAPEGSSEGEQSNSQSE